MLETTISELQAAVIRLTQVIEQGLAHVNAPAAPSAGLIGNPPPPAPVYVPTATPAPTPAPLVIPTLIPPVAAPAPAAAMPPPPTFAMPAAAPGALPFTDSASLVGYVMGVYKQIGPAKGAGIQNVLTSLGVVNLTDVKPEHYAQFYAGIEALKV